MMLHQGRCVAPSAQPLLEPLESRLLLDGVPPIVISEIMHHPIPYDLGTEYIELFNPGGGSIDLNGWKLTKAVEFTFGPGPTPIGAGEYLVVAADAAAFHAKYPAVSNYVGGWTGRLSNSRDAIELQDALGAVVDQVSYADQGDWGYREQGRGVKLVEGITRSGTTATVTITEHGYRSGDSVEIFGADQGGYNGVFTISNPTINTFDYALSGTPGSPATGKIYSRQRTDLSHSGWSWIQWADGLGKSLELINPALTNDEGQNWASSTVDNGTPGAANSVASSDIAPMILDLQQSIIVPKSTEAVTVTARIVDELGTAASATLYYRIDAVSPPPFTALTMHDDGTGGDAVAGDGIWSAVIPAQANNSIVEFYVSATDAGAKTRTWPAPARDLSGAWVQSANLLYQVDDTPYTGTQPLFKIIVTENERLELADIGDTNQTPANEKESNAQMNATFISQDTLGTEIRYIVAVRNRGAGARDDYPQNSYRVNINTDKLWKDLSALNLNGRYSMEDIAGSAVFRMAGLPAQNIIPVQVRLNNVNNASMSSYDMFGSYAFLEVQNTEMADSHWPLDPSGNYYRGIRRLYGNNPDADLSYHGTDPNGYRQDYAKHTNVEDDDWTDIINLTRAFDPTETPDGAFAAAINANLDALEWLRYFAVSSLIGDQETTLSTGYGDDYDLYRGLIDTRFQIIVHDTDTILGRGDTTPNTAESIFRAAALAAVNRLLTHPAFAPLYYAELNELINTTFSPAVIDPLLDNVLGGYVPASAIQVMKDFVVARNTNVLTQINRALTVTSYPAVQGAYPHTTSDTCSLGGQADVIRTRSVLVNGAPATWAWSASLKTWTWSAPNVSLPHAGMNRVLIQSLDEDGREFDRMYFDVWREGGTMTDVSGTLPSGTTTWTAAAGQYHVTGNLTVPAGATLVIEPDVTVFVESGLKITVSGRLDAQGSGELHSIVFTKAPMAGNWAGIEITYPSYSSEINRISYASINYGDTASHAIEALNSQLVLDHLYFGGHTKQYLTIDDSSIIVTNSTFPSITNAELIHFWGLPATGYARFEGNVLGSTTGYNDVIDFTSVQPGVVSQFLNNRFLGGNDDAIDLDGTDAYVEGNVFMHFHQESARESQSHGVTTGTESGLTSHITVVGNLFYDMDHGVLIKDGGVGTIVNNTFVNIHKTLAATTTAAINVYEARSGQWEGDSVYADGNIFYDVSQLLQNPDWTGHPVGVAINNSLYPDTGETVHWTGTGNLVVSDPDFYNTLDVRDPWNDFRLRPGSPAIGSGPNRRDMGAVVPAGASISGEPTSPTFQTGATLTVGGPESYGYKYRLDDGPWSAEMGAMKSIESITRSGSTATATLTGHGYANGDVVDIYGAKQPGYNGTFTISNVTADTFDFTVSGTPASPATGTTIVRRREPIQLSALADGDHHVDVIARNFAGVWQDSAHPTASKTWTVNTGLGPHVRINEVLADNTNAVNHEGTYPDVIELYNDGQGTMDLSDLSITDDPLVPRKFVFSGGTTLNEGQYLVLYADNPNGTSGIHLGFALKGGGEGVYLYDKLSNGGGQIDSVVFGRQVEDYSIGRRADGTWGIATPTFGGANQVLPQASGVALKINEWLTQGVPPFSNDFIELYNPDPLPVDIGGFYITDNPDGWPTRHQIAPLTFVPAGGFFVFQADSDPQQGADHTNFKLAFEQGMVGLRDSTQRRIDTILYGTQRRGVSQGRTPDGATMFAFFSQPSPGVTNPRIVSQTLTLNLVGITATWKYNESRTDLGTAWKEYSYDDNVAGWGSGAALFYNETASLPAPKNTPLSLRPAGSPTPPDTPTYYFRIHFNLSVDPSDVTSFQLQTVLDDGVVVWLNGSWVYGNSVPSNSTKSVSGITRSGSAATATTSSAHGYKVGEVVVISGANQAEYNGTFTIATVPTTTTFTYAVSGTPATPATGTIQVLRTNYGTYSSRNVGDAVYEGPYDLATGALRAGDNVLAAEVHQSTATSSDIVWGGTLTGTAQVSALPPPPLRITEVHYNPTGGGTYASNDYEFLELRNIGTEPLNLENMQFTAGISFTFPNMTLAPGENTVVVKNQTAFTSRYGSGINIAGQYGDSLDNVGEEIRLVDATGNTISDFSYSNTWYPATDGGGYSLVIVDPNADPATWASMTSWQPSRFLFGSPGIDEPTFAIDSVVVNEVMSHSHALASDWIELRNTTASPIDIGGWYLSDSAANLLKFWIPTGTTIPADGPSGFVVFDEAIDFGNASNPRALVPFALSELGDEVYVSSADSAGVLTGYHQMAKFGAAETGVTFGRYTRSTGDVVFIALSTPTPLAANAYPKVGPVVINELMYNPNGADEYIELRNVTGDDVPLYDPLHPENTWKFTDGIDFTFPQDVTLPAYGYLLLTRYDPEAFRTARGIPAFIQIFGPYDPTALNNGGENVALSKPGGPEPDLTVPYILVDSVNYDNAAPWPTSPDGGGPSLARLVSTNYGDDVINWAAESPDGSPGYMNFDSTPPTADIIDVTPDPRNTAVSSITIAFSEPVLGFGLGDLGLTRDGNPLALSGATLTSGDNITWTLGNLSGLTGTSGSHVLTLTASGSGITDLADNALGSDASDTFVVDTTPPEVTNVLVSGTGWAGGFLSYLQAQGLGAGGYAIPVGSGVQLKPLPWTNINQIKVVFSEDVTIEQADVRLVGVNVSEYAISGFSYDPVSYTATLTLGSSIGSDKLLLELNADGADPIRDGVGNALDGEWDNAASASDPVSDTYPSGDGVAGVNFEFRLNVLPGDASQNGYVQSADGLTVRGALGSSTTFGSYSILKDVNANGYIQSSDGLLVRGRLGGSLPVGEPVAGAFGELTASGFGEMAVAPLGLELVAPSAQVDSGTVVSAMQTSEPATSAPVNSVPRGSSGGVEITGIPVGGMNPFDALAAAVMQRAGRSGRLLGDSAALASLRPSAPTSLVSPSVGGAPFAPSLKAPDSAADILAGIRTDFIDLLQAIVPPQVASARPTALAGENASTAAENPVPRALSSWYDLVGDPLNAFRSRRV